jgi:hypothetical protein
MCDKEDTQSKDDGSRKKTTTKRSEKNIKLDDPHCSSDETEDCITQEGYSTSSDSDESSDDKHGQDTIASLMAIVTQHPTLAERMVGIGTTLVLIGSIIKMFI